MAVVTKAVYGVRPENAPFDAGLNQVIWHIRWDDPDLPFEVNGSYIREETCTEDYKSASFVRFMQGIDMDPSGFEPDEETGELPDVHDIAVMATVRHRLGKRNERGERRIFPYVVNITQPE